MVSPRFVLVILCAVVAACGNRFTSGSTNRVVFTPEEPLPADHATVGLVSVAGGEGRLRADWRRGSADVSTLEFALFVAPDRATVLSANPIVVDVVADSVIVQGLPVAAQVFVQLGVRRSALDSYRASGPVLTASTRRPLFVDPTVASGVGDGLTEATPTSDLVLALLTVLSQGGGNVYVAAGDVPNATFPLFTGVQLIGGFAPGFALDARDPAVHRTRFTGVDTQTMLRVETGVNGPAVVDGVDLQGSFGIPAAIDVPQKWCEVRRVNASGFSRGLKVRGLSTGPVFDVLVTGSTFSGSELEGLSVDAAADIVIERSTFDLNGNEGADFNHLWAPPSTTAHLTVRNSAFTRNGTEGLDVHLGSPGGTVGGRFVIDVADSDFEVNALAGARVDVDYEATPAWSSTIVVSGSRARANGGAGLHFDLDSTCTALAHRAALSANSLDGLLVTSESASGTVALTSSAAYGNLGYGARLAQGNFGLLASHCVFSGNALGGIDSPIVKSSVHSSVFHLEPRNAAGLDVIACATTSFGDVPQFLRAPREYTTITTAAGTSLTLSAPTLSGSGFLFEAADDSTPRAVTSAAGTIMVIDPALGSIRTPARGAFFDQGGASDEDWRLSVASIAHGVGLAAVGAPPVDAGIFGASLSGVPGSSDAVSRPLFRVADTLPRWTSAITSATPMRILFEEGLPSPADVPLTVYGVSAAGSVLGTTAFVDGDDVLVHPPAAGWQAGDRIEVHAGLRSTTGEPLAFAAAIPLRLQ